MIRDATPDEERVLRDVLAHLGDAATDEFPLDMDDVHAEVLKAGFRLPDGHEFPEPAAPSDAALDWMKRRDDLHEFTKTHGFESMTAYQRTGILERLDLLDMFIDDDGRVDHTTHEWCDPTRGCEPGA